MKIQIIGPPRSGTTCLYFSLLGSIKYTMGIFEPLNPGWNYDLTSFSKLEHHVKVINNHQTVLIEKNIVGANNFGLDFYKTYLKNFDRIILLGRKDIEDQAKSYKYSSTTDNWHLPYSLPKDNYKDMIPILQSQNKLISQLSNYLEVPIVYYEDLYSNNKTYLNNFLKYYKINLDSPQNFYNKMNNKYRLRQS